MTSELKQPSLPDPLDELAPDVQARLHLSAIWPELLPFESYELRCLDMRTKPAGKGPREFLSSVEAVVEAAMRYRDRWDVFVGVGTRCCPDALSMKECRHSEKGEDHVSRLQAVWGDFDADSPAELQDQIDKLTGLSVPPTVLVGSGTGVHAYWPLLEPTNELSRVRQVNRGLRLRYGADNAIDSARILRVAGTLNHKHGDPLPVRLLAVPGV